MKVKSLSYKKGISLPKIKSITASQEVKRLEAPKYVYISVKQAKGVLPKPIVVVGDHVKIGSLVASYGDNKVYSTVSGDVVKVEPMPSVYGGLVDTIVIENDYKDEKELICSPGETSSEGIFQAIKDGNIVDYDGISLYTKIEKAKDISMLVINAVTDEPYETTNLEIIKSNIKEVVEGAKIIAEQIKTKSVTLAISKDYYSEVKNVLTDEIWGEGGKDFSILLCPNCYPVGDEAELYSAIKKRNLKPGENAIGKGVFIVDIYTLYMVSKLFEDCVADVDRLISVYDATQNQPIVTNVVARVGTDIKEIIQSVRSAGLLGIRKVVAGGPMRGIALGDALAPITKGLKSVILFKNRIAEEPREIACINCGKCQAVCPKNISPKDIGMFTENFDMVMAKKLGAEECTKCGCCSYVCPSKRHLAQRISYAKDYIKDKGI